MKLSIIMGDTKQPLRSGFLFIDKETGPTSHDVIDDLRRITGFRRIGHAGTLDPFASGMLIVAVGRLATKNLVNLLGLDKKYIGTIRLGAASNTDDATGEIKENPEAKKPNIEEVRKAIEEFRGGVLQAPPIFSAKRVEGKKMYQLARAGKAVERPPEWVMIYDIVLDDYKWPYVKLSTHTGSGVYLRSIARDLGKKLGVGGYLHELDRAAVGPFDKSLSVKIRDLTRENWISHTHTWQELRQKLAVNKMFPDSTVLVFGTFDKFHLGHHFFLSEASKLGNKLVAAVARDEHVQKHKNKKPSQDEETRLKHIKKLSLVNEAIYDRPEGDWSLLDEIKPDIIALGYDQRGEFEEMLKKVIDERGLKTKLIHMKPFKPEIYSSSKINEEAGLA